MAEAVIEVVLEAGATLGESPTWSAADGCLYWIDVRAPALHRYHPASGATRRWPVEAEIGAFALEAGLSGAVVALRTGVFRLDFASGGTERLAPPPFDPALHRFNDGVCDADGRFWIGVMHDPVDPGGGPSQEESLYSFTRADGLRREPDTSDLHNGMAWSADGTRLFVTHTTERTIHSFAFDAASGRLGERRVFATVPASLGLPDGAAVDTAGGYWCALHGASRLRRFSADGSVDRDVMLPVSQPTMCAFGGDDLDVLYVTSAAENLGPVRRVVERHAGALLRFRPGERGVARRCTVR